MNMPDTVIVGVLGLLGVVFNSIMVCVLNQKAEQSKKVGESIHVLVNSNMQAQLKISAIALRRIALLTSDKEDKIASQLADKLLREHEKKQTEVDYLSSISH